MHNLFFWKSQPKTPNDIEKILTPGGRHARKKNVFTFESAEAGWNKLIEETTPENDSENIPIQPIEANLNQNLFGKTDPMFSGYTWVLSMTEQFFYDNTILLLNNYKDHVNNIARGLKSNFSPPTLEYLSEAWTDITILGCGAYGTVFKAVDIVEKTNYAIKFINDTSGHHIQHSRYIINYITERNYLIKARKSPYVVQFHYALNDKEISGLFLVFEYCISDLRFYNEFMYKNMDIKIQENLARNTENFLPDSFKKISEKMGFDAFYVCKIFCFECLVILDFLANCNICHRDIKPHNLLISQTFHLKLADFGLVYNTYFVNSKSQLAIVNHNEIDSIESLTYAMDCLGTPLYRDIEGQLHDLSALPESKEEFFYNCDTCQQIYAEDNFQDFLTDLWAMAVTITESLFLGDVIFLPLRATDESKQLTKNEYDDVPRFVLKYCICQSNYDRMIKNGFRSVGGPELEEFMTFLSSVFLTRKLRAVEYTKTKIFRWYKLKSITRCLDIEIIMKMKLFSEMNLHPSNSFLRKMPDQIGTYLIKDEEPNYDTFGEFIEDIRSEESEERHFNFEPGTSIYFR